MLKWKLSSRHSENIEKVTQTWQIKYLSSRQYGITVSLTAKTYKNTTQKWKQVNNNQACHMSYIYFLQHSIFKESYPKVRKKTRGEESIGILVSVLKARPLELFHSLGTFACVWLCIHMSIGVRILYSYISTSRLLLRRKDNPKG